MRIRILDSVCPLFYNQNELILQRKFSFHRRGVFSIVLFSAFLSVLVKGVSGQEKIIKLKVVSDQANIRLEPDISSIIIRQVIQGTILSATEKTGDWYAIRFTPKQGTIVSGFVHESLVLVIDPIPEEKEPPKILKIRPEEPEFEEVRQTSPPKFLISLTAGGNYVRGGELNPGLEGLASLYEDILGIRGDGTIDSVHWGYVFGAEVSFPLSERLSWGVGAEHLQAKNDSRVDYPQGSATSILRIKPDVRATPINLFLAFHPVPYLYAKGAISYYFARFSYAYLFQADDGTQQWEGKSDARGLGLTGSIGFSKKYSSHLSLFAEVTGRLVKIDGFKGKENFQDSSGKNSMREGTLYLIQTQVLEDRTHPILFIRESRPNEAGVIAAEKASIDFSGICLKIGLRFHF